MAAPAASSPAQCSAASRAARSATPSPRARRDAARSGATTTTAIASASPSTDRFARPPRRRLRPRAEGAFPSRGAPRRPVAMNDPRPDSALAARFIPSPNHGERRGPTRPNSVILHYTGMASGEAALALLCDPASEVSAHYLVWENGSVDQLVSESRRAWHAGKSVWKGETDMNSASIGVEIVNPGHDGGAPPFPPKQIDAVIALLRDVCGRWRIP